VDGLSCWLFCLAFASIEMGFTLYALGP